MLSIFDKNIETRKSIARILLSLITPPGQNHQIMNRFVLLFGASTFIYASCNPSQNQDARNTADSLQQEMEKEMDTAKQKLDSLGDSLNEATSDFLDEAEKTLEKAGESLKDSGK